MDQISYQNGFVCGMATKGLVRSGQLYQPIIYNDTGVYDYFYIDFRRALEPFSLGMWNESIVVHDSVQLEVSGIENSWTQNPYTPITEPADLFQASLTNIDCTNGALTLEVG